MRILGLAVVASLACGNGRDVTPAAPAAPPVVAVRDAAVAAAPIVPATDLLAAIPADTAFVLAGVDPLPAALWRRVLPELDGAAIKAAADVRAASALDPLAQLRYAVWIELGTAVAAPDGIASLGLAAHPRFALYGAGMVPVLRIELGDPAAAERTIDRIAKRAGGVRQAGMAWRFEGGDAVVAIAIAGGVLAVAMGPRDGVTALAPHLGDAAPHPITEAALRDFAKQRGLSPSAAGWIEPARFAALLRTPGLIADLDLLSPPCRTEALAVIADLPQIAFGLGELTSTRWRLSVGGAVDPANAAAYAKLAAALPALPAELGGHPLFAASVISPPQQTSPWLARLERLETTCGEAEQPLHLPAPWNTLTAGALVVHDGVWQGFLPSAIDAYAGATGDAGALLTALGKVLPKLAAKRPADGGPFVDAMLPSLAAYLPALAVARRGNAVVAATGPQGKAHVTELAPRADAPAFRVFVDVARLRERIHAGDARPKVDDDEFYRGEEQFAEAAGLGTALANLIGTIDLEVGSRDGRFELAITGTVAPPHARGSQPPSDPRLAVRDQCRTILRHALAATRPALAKLGVTTDLDAIALTYTTSIEADGAIRSCAKLTAKERSCLLAAADALAAAATCAPSGDAFHDSRLELPALFSFFGPRPLEARMHPKLDGTALPAKLAGTWITPDETWVIDAAGHATIKPVDGPLRRGTLVFTVAGKVDLVDGDDRSTMSFVQLAPDRFVLAENAAIVAEDRFVASYDRGFVVREPAGCAVVTEHGRLLAAQCTPGTDHGTHTLEVAAAGHTATYWLVGKTVFERNPNRDAFVRRH